MAGFEWPEQVAGAVSLTFDDGMRSQREIAVPLLDRHDLKATFYLNPKDDFATALAPWQAAAAAGHELGNHTVNHPCSKNFSFITENRRQGLEDMSWEQMAWEIDETSRRLDALVPDQGAVSFAYPCYQPFIGRGMERRSYVPLVVERCVAGRGRGERPNDPAYCDLGYLWSFACERMSAAELIGLAEQAANEGKWAIMTFHGVHEGHLSIGENDLEELAGFLARQRNRIWTGTVAEVATWVGARQSVSV